jgi:hypothetical protein
MDPFSLSLLIGGITSLGGAGISGLFNQKAAATNAAAQQQAAQVQAQALQQEQAQFQQLQQEGQPGVKYLQDTVADPGDLTKLQQQHLDELRRTQTNQVRTSAIQGSGRTAASLFRDTSNDFINKSLEANRNRAFGAAGQLAGASFNAGTNAANVSGQIGQVQGNALRNIGSTDAAAGLATGKVFGSAVGDIGSYIASAGRASKYRDMTGGGGGSSGGYSAAPASPSDWQRYPDNAYVAT